VVLRYKAARNEETAYPPSTSKEVTLYQMVRPVMALKVGRDSPYEVENTIAIADISRGNFVRHFARHQSREYDKRLNFSDVREKMVPGGGVMFLA
jgi:hypothetical protein